LLGPCIWLISIYFFKKPPTKNVRGLNIQIKKIIFVF